MTATDIVERPRARKLRGAVPLFGMLAVAALVATQPGLVEASSSAQGLPWEGPLTKIVDSITGPVAFAFSAIAVVGCGIGLAMGGDMNEFLRRCMMLTMAVALIVFAVNFLSSVMGVGAVIDLPTAAQLGTFAAS
jgi:type IV secretion system protein VirB2